ncbi:MAG: DUF2341 domain-containing protein [Candidatus Methylomirabilales bacterium]
MSSLLHRTPDLDRTTRPAPPRRAWGLAAVIIVVGLALASPAAAITYVGERGTLSNAACTTTPQTITVGSNATAGNTVILVFVSRAATTTASVADSVGNTWTVDVGPLNGNNDFVFIASTRQNVATLQNGNTVTVTLGAAPTSTCAAILEEFSGLQTSAGYVDVSNNATNGGAPYVSGTTATTSQASELAVTGFSLNHVTGFTITPDPVYSSFTTSTILPGGTGYPKDLVAQYRILSTTGTQSSTITTTNGGSSYQGMIVTYKAASCSAVADATYVAANAQPTQAIVTWASGNPVVILRKSGTTISDVPANGTTYTAGNTIGASTVIYDGTNTIAGVTCTGTSCTNTGLTNGTVYYYKVFAKSGTCYAPGTSTQVIARPVAAPIPAWSYNFAGGSILVAGIAGSGTLYTTSNASRIIGLSTATGTQLWAPVATNAPIQAYLTWLPAASGWLYRKPITINHTKVSAALTNFPVLISLATDADLQANAQASGNDIFFTAADGATKLNHEIETYNSSTGQLVAWVQVPSLSNTTDTVLYMYYGNAAASNQQNVTGTWDTNYKAVWHLDESGNGTAGEFKDSTGVNNGQGGAGSSAATPAQATGEIGYGQNFPSNDYIQVANSTSLNTNITSQLTMEVWVKLTTPSNNQKVMGKTPIGSGYLLAVQTGGLYPEIWDSAGTDYSFTSGTITANTWTHLAVTWTTGGSMIGYINGAQVNSIAASTNNIGTTTNVLNIGKAPWGAQFYVAGLLDEVRISNTARSAAWILTEYTNQSAPGAFYTVGAAQTDSGVAVFGADQNGYAYSVDAGGGATTWQGQPNAGVDKFQAPVAAQAWGWANATFQTTYNDDVLFVPTQNGSGTSNNKLYALKRRDGTVLWTFSPGTLDMIVGMPWVDYTRNYVYVTSYSKGNTQPSLWVINSLTGALVQSWSLNDIAASPTLSVDGKTLYVVTTGGNLYALDMSTLNYKWTGTHYAALGSAVQGFIWENGDLPGRLYFATSNGNVWCVQDPGSGVAPPNPASPTWKTAVAGPATPLWNGTYVYVGSSDGKVHQLLATTGADQKQYCLNPPGSGSCTAMTVGDVSTETGNEIFVPTSDGTVYKLPLPLP